MQRLRCPSCLVRPPAGTRAYERCPRCSGALLAEARCAWCLSWSAGGTCADCTAELVPLPDFGAARMLVSGGVDRYALVERCRALSRNQHGALSARFDEEWGALAPRLEEARFVVSFLVLEGHVDEIETQLLSLLPMSKELRATMTAPSLVGDLTSLPVIAERSPHYPTAFLAEVAKLRTGQADRDAERRVHHLAFMDEGLRGAEATLAIARAAVVEGTPPTLGGEEKERLRAAVERAPVTATSAGWIALARGWLGPPSEGVTAGLRAAVVAKDPDLRLGAAVLLEDEVTLGKLLADPSGARRERARRTLAALGSDAVVRDLEGVDEEAQRQILRHLRHPLGRVLLEGVLRAIERSAGVRSQGLRLLRDKPFEALPEATRSRLGAFVEAASFLDDAALLELFAWATAPTEQRHDAPPTVDAQREPFVRAVTRRLAALGPAGRAAVLERSRGELERWLRVESPEVVAPVLDGWARDAVSADDALDLCLDLHGRLNGWGTTGDDRGWRFAIGVLDRGGEPEARRLGRALARHRGVSGREAIVESLWQRLGERPERRRLTMIAGEPYRAELKELRRLREPIGDPARFFATYAEADPLDAPALVSEACEAIEAGAPESLAALLPLIEAVEAYATPRLASWPCTVTRTIANLSAAVANRYRGGDTVDEALTAAAHAIAPMWQRLEPLARSPTPVVEDEARFAHVVEHIELEIRLIRERAERLAEQARLIEEREHERRRRDEERERQRRLREEEHRRVEAEVAQAQAAAEAQRAAAAAMAAASQATALVTAERALTMVPHVAREGIDREPLLPDQPLPTLEDYARILKAMQQGTDVMALFAAAGLTPMTWAGCAGAWTQVIMARPHVAQRFAALLASTWG